ncbi:hypothetical protein C5L28_002684 [Lentilactobacillus parakefiri]|uniref:Biotin biosynthesis protein BioY n=1 Tax=Lentilactobacillus parakefiri TaxID=152332 RepID=A0A224VD54_9LACO|nr:hypothetical protein C5L28_002684 [Lentilactobacillus parakefiri]GAW72865.1 biotin biosynthesis protein BioY [Lentilactobacillus parakefiri]
MKIRQLTQTSLMIATIIVLGMIPPIPLGVIPVPIVMQNLGIMLAGILLGSKNGTIAVGVFLVLAFLGFPVLSGGQAGPAVFIGPTAGYLVGWLINSSHDGLQPLTAVCEPFMGSTICHLDQRCFNR